MMGSLLMILAGLMLVSLATDLVLIFVGLELISIPTYVILYLGRGSNRLESGTKYFFLERAFQRPDAVWIQLSVWSGRLHQLVADSRRAARRAGPPAWDRSPSWP